MWNCSAHQKRSCSGLHPQPALHSEPDHLEQAHSEPQHSEPVRFAGRISAERGRRSPQRPAEEEEEALPAALSRLMCRNAGHPLATPASEVARALPKKQYLHKQPHPKKKQLAASTHQSFGQYPSLCAIQQRGSFQSRIGGSAFMVNHPGLQGAAFCPKRGYNSPRTIFCVRRNSQPRGHIDLANSNSPIPRAARALALELPALDLTQKKLHLVFALKSLETVFKRLRSEHL